MKQPNLTLLIRWNLLYNGYFLNGNQLHHAPYCGRYTKFPLISGLEWRDLLLTHLLTLLLQWLEYRIYSHFFNFIQKENDANVDAEYMYIYFWLILIDISTQYLYMIVDFSDEKIKQVKRCILFITNLFKYEKTIFSKKCCGLIT